jgi:hypothetical protein
MLILAAVLAVAETIEARSIQRVPPTSLRRIVVLPSDLPSKPRVAAAGFIDERKAGEIAAAYRAVLIGQGYVEAAVEPELVRAGAGQADLLLRVTSGRRVRIARVEIAGDAAVPAKQIRASLRSLRRGAPYSSAGVEADVARLLAFYVSRGYLTSSVRLDHTSFAGDRATVYLRVEAGRQSGGERSDTLCRCLLDARRRAERDGVLDFAPVLRLRDQELVTDVARGPVYRIRRIDIQGNRRTPDRLIRRQLLLDEGDLLDATLLRTSLERLNRTAMFEPLEESAVEIRTDAAAGVADVRIRVTEQKAGSWSLSGPVGPMSLGGRFQFRIAARLPWWGSVSMNLLAYRVPLAFAALERPYLPSNPWTSGFAIAPQLGWRSAAWSYGSTRVHERLLPWIAGQRVPAVSSSAGHAREIPLD